MYVGKSSLTLIGKTGSRRSRNEATPSVTSGFGDKSSKACESRLCPSHGDDALSMLHSIWRADPTAIDDVLSAISRAIARAEGDQ